MMMSASGAGKKHLTPLTSFYRFITRNKQHRVGVDAYIVQGEHNEQYLCEYNLNISHRTNYEDVEKH
jgi:hypothetical protein